MLYTKTLCPLLPSYLTPALCVVEARGTFDCDLEEYLRKHISSGLCFCMCLLISFMFVNSRCGLIYLAVRSLNSYECTLFRVCVGGGGYDVVYEAPLSNHVACSGLTLAQIRYIERRVLLNLLRRERKVDVLLV
jgi:hypothetical protein